MTSPWERPLDHRYRGEHPIRTLAYLLRADRRRLLAAVAVCTVKHSPVWLLPLITASLIDTVVQHRSHPVHPADHSPRSSPRAWSPSVRWARSSKPPNWRTTRARPT
ncbi:hypothetical protein ACWCQ0_38335 [Streptomyces massasporeus]